MVCEWILIDFSLGSMSRCIIGMVIDAAPTFRGQDFLDIQDRTSYTSQHKKEVLIKNFTPSAESLKFPILHTWKMINLSLKNSVLGG